MKRRPLIVLAIAVVAAVFFFAVNPADAPFPYPRCWFKLLIGWDCPGCGTSRALHSLMHGRFCEALDYNPGLVVILPLVLLMVLADTGRYPRLRPLLSQPAALTVLLLAAAYTILRNI